MGQSSAETLAELRRKVGEALFEEAVKDRSDEDWEKMRWSWDVWARPEQMLPPEPWTTWLILAGRGFGKTRTGAESVRELVKRGAIEHIGIVAKTPADARDVMIEGPAGILAVSPPTERPTWEPSVRRLTWPNGARATVFSGENPDQLRGPQHQLVWVDELMAFQYPQDTWDNIAFGLRLPWRDGSAARAIITTTPRPTKLLRSIMNLAGAVVTRGSTFENRGNLDRQFLEQMKERYEGTRLGRQELFAELLEDVEGALWTPKMIDGCRARDYPALTEVVVAIDPAVTSNGTSAETGIIVVGRGSDGHAYVLQDVSGVYSPSAWATKACEVFAHWEADAIVAEVNNGGEMIKHTINTVAPSVTVRQVRASRGKVRRAEPIASLYEQGKVHHVGQFNELEDQLTTYTGDAGEKSPDRMDAVVWGLASVMLSERDQKDLGFA